MSSDSATSAHPSASTIALFTSSCAKIFSTSQVIDELVHRPGDQAASISTAASELVIQLKLLCNVTNRLRQTLQDGVRPVQISENTLETLHSTTTTTSDILLDIADDLTTLTPIVASDSERRRSSVSSIIRASFRSGSTSSSPSVAATEQHVQDCVRMVMTQIQIFGLIDQVLSLDKIQDQDSAMETGENLKILLRGARDAEKVREKRRAKLDTASQVTSSFRRESATTELSVATTNDTSIHSDTGGPSSASSAMANGATTSTTTTKSTARKSPSSISKLFDTLKVGPSGIGNGNTKSSANKKLAFVELCQACCDGDINWARHQITEGADVNGTDAKHYSPLHYAILQGNLDLVKMLAEAGAWVSGSDGRSSIMVFLAVQKRNLPVLTYLLDDRSAPVSSRCCDSNDRNLFRTPLSVAVETGQKKAVELLVHHGADVEERDMTPSGYSFTPLCTAVNIGNKEMVEILLKSGAQIDETKSTTSWGSDLGALHVASYNGHDKIMEVLLDNGANKSIPCKRVLSSSKDKGGDRVPGLTAGVTALHLANGKCAAILLRYGASVFSRDGNSQFPLSGVVQLRNVESVKILLENGAPVNAQDQKGDTALHITCRLFARNATKLVNKLESNRRNSRLFTSAADSKLHTQVSLGPYIAIAEELVDRGANPGSRAATRRIILGECEAMISRRSSPTPAGPAAPPGGAAGRGGEPGTTELPPTSSPPHLGDVTRLELVDLMKLVQDIVRVEQQGALAAASSTASLSGPARDTSGLGGFLSQTALAHLVTR